MSIENNEWTENNNNLNNTTEAVSDNESIVTAEETISSEILEDTTTNQNNNSKKEEIFNIESEEENKKEDSGIKKTIHVNKKIIWNAISAYLLLFISSMFLFNKKDDDINNSFVKAHTKSALVLHLGFFITWLIFMKIGFLKSITVFWTTWLNSIFSICIFLGLFSWILYWAYRAHLWKYFLLGDILKLPWMESTIVEEETEININEKNKLIVIMSFIPFVWYYLFPEHTEKSLIRNTTKLNLISTSIIIFLLISNQPVLSSLFILWYLIFIVYSIVNLLSKNEIPHIKLSFILTPEDSFHVSKWIKKYLTAFFKKEKFMNLRELLKNEKEKFKLEEKSLEEELKDKLELKFPKELIYVPLINLMFLGSLDSKYKYHIRSWLTITVYLIVTYILGLIAVFPTSINIFILIPIFYWTWYLKTRLAYRMPYVYWLYEKSTIIFNIAKEKSKKVKEMKNKNENVNLKVKEEEVINIQEKPEEINIEAPIIEVESKEEEIVPTIDIEEITEIEEVSNTQETPYEINIEVPIVEVEKKEEETISNIDIEEIVEIDETNNILKKDTISSLNTEDPFEEEEINKGTQKKESDNSTFDISALENSINIK